MVSTAGMNGTSEISEKDAPRERNWIGRKAQIIPVGANARAVERLTEARWFVSTRSLEGEAVYTAILKVSSG